MKIFASRSKHLARLTLFGWFLTCCAHADVSISVNQGNFKMEPGPPTIKTYDVTYRCATSDNKYMSKPFTVTMMTSWVWSDPFPAQPFLREINSRFGEIYTVDKYGRPAAYCSQMYSEKYHDEFIFNVTRRNRNAVEVEIKGVDRDLWMVVLADSRVPHTPRGYFSKPVRIARYPTAEQLKTLDAQFRSKASLPEGFYGFKIAFGTDEGYLRKELENKLRGEKEPYASLDWTPRFGPLSKVEQKKQQEEERQQKLAEQKAKQEAEKQKKLEADKLAKEQAERERQRKAEETRRAWEAKLYAQNQAIQERAAPVMTQVDDAVFQEADKAAKKKDKKKDKKNLQQFMEAVVVCTKPNGRGGFRCEGPLTAMDGSASDISGFRSPEEMVAKNMNAQCPDLRPLSASGDMKVWGCGFAATGGANAKDASGGLVIPGRQTYYCTPQQLSCRNQTAPSDL